MRALLLLLAACSHAAPLSGARPTTGVGLSVWSTLTLQENQYGCAPAWIRPATLCPGFSAPDFDGCRWRCLPVAPRWQ